MSEDAQVQVRLLSPPLSEREKEREKGKDQDKGRDEGDEKMMSVAVSSGISAMWEGVDGGEDEVIAKNGKFCWIVALPGQGKSNLVLKYEVGAPAGENVIGLP